MLGKLQKSTTFTSVSAEQTQNLPLFRIFPPPRSQGAESKCIQKYSFRLGVCTRWPRSCWDFSRACTERANVISEIAEKNEVARRCVTLHYIEPPTLPGPHEKFPKCCRAQKLPLAKCGKWLRKSGFWIPQNLPLVQKVCTLCMSLFRGFSNMIL